MYVVLIRSSKSVRVQAQIQIAVGCAIGKRRSILNSRLAGAGATETVGTVLQFELLAAGCADGVGLTPWNQVEVP